MLLLVLNGSQGILRLGMLCYSLSLATLEPSYYDYYLLFIAYILYTWKYVTIL